MASTNTSAQPRLGATLWLKASTPTAAHPDSTPAAIVPVASEPQSAAIRRHNPNAWSPNPGDAVPIVITAGPDVIRTGCRRRHFRWRRRRRLRGDYGRAWRRFLQSTRGGSGRRSRRRGTISSSCRRWRRDIDWLAGRATSYDHSGKGGHCRSMTNFHFHTKL
jgi:hypothetical protein